MIKALQTRAWVCSSCLRRSTSRPTQRRWLSAVSAAAQQREQRIVPSSHAAPGQTIDDSVLRQIFDSPSVWKSFAKTSGPKHVGLFRNAYLTDPRGFLTFANVNLERAQKIVEKVLQASTIGEYRRIVRDLDRLSDLLCRVLDMSDFVRVTHPDARIQQAASEAWSMVYQYMNQLNTMTGLDEQLGRAMGDPEVTKAWSEEEKTVAELLKIEFTKSAVNLPQAERDRFVDLSQRISTVGATFVDEMAPAQSTLVLPSSKLQGMDPQVARRYTHRGQVYLPAMGAHAAAALRQVHDEDTRKAILYATRTASAGSVEKLEHMLGLRADLAQLSGFDSYAQMALRDRMMAKSPESVTQFLQAVSQKNAPVVKQEVQDLLREKQERVPSATSLQPWDKEYYAESIRQKMRSKARRDDFLPSYFSLGTVMQGLSRIFTRLYGIRFVPRETLPGETWHPDVRRLDVVSDTDGHVAVLYCDLFYREDKSPNPAHFTVRCSREIAESELEEMSQTPSSEGLPNFETPEEAANDGMSLSRQNGVLKQLPTIALVCDFHFPRASSLFSARGGSQPAVLSFFQMETLFHEMGHAIHSVLARTSLQNVAGTRCATDLAELPSTLMEYFAADPTVLALFARHHETDEPLDYELVAEQLRLSRRFDGLDTENQILLAMLDQELHSARAGVPGLDSTAVYHGLQRSFGHAPPDPPGTRWQGFFGHLFGYGSTYYSYLFDRVLAERVWRVVFGGRARGGSGAAGALRRENGERLKESLLKWGGSRDPWQCLAETLGDERLRAGDERAMALVGTWGAADGASKS